MNGKKTTMFSWKRLKHRGGAGKLQDRFSPADSSVDFSSYRSAEMSSTSDCTAVSKPVEAAEIMALARYYDKLCNGSSSKALQTTTTSITNGLDTLHAESSPLSLF